MEKTATDSPKKGCMAGVICCRIQSTLIVSVVSLLFAYFGCNHDAPTRTTKVRDVVPEFAYCVSRSHESVLVVSNRVLHRFTFDGEKGSIATRTENLKAPWPGRVLSIHQVPDSELFVATVFDANARQDKSATDRLDDLDGIAHYSFRLQNGKFEDLHLLKIRAEDLLFLSSSALMYTAPSHQEFSRDCDVSGLAKIADCTTNAKEPKIEISEPSNNSTIFCKSMSGIRYTSSRNLPFLINRHGVVTGEWQAEKGFRFVPLSVEKPPELAGAPDASQGYHHSFSMDVSNDKMLLATSITLPTLIRFSVWSTNDGKLELDTTYSNNQSCGIFNPVRCFSLEERMFLLAWGSTIRIVDWKGNIFHDFHLQQLGQEYKNAAVLSAEVKDQDVQVVVVLTPFDTQSVRRILIPLEKQNGTESQTSKNELEDYPPLFRHGLESVGGIAQFNLSFNFNSKTGDRARAPLR